ncbi:MAG: NUDIX hydrolase [Curvibacter sp.]|jgi:8-oxo-dGTP pyrophosphatase MutT (NUDIX family)|nr:NUDIX hydrolase [Curvibacter sp.]
MELNRNVIDTPPRDAATVAMLRDTPGGLEVFLLKRASGSDVLAGAYVFPGGKIDAADAALTSHLDRPAAVLQAALGETGATAEFAASCYVAALREAFEESGVLFAHGASVQQVAQAAAMLRAGHGFAEVLTRLGLRLDTGSVLPWSRWVTPRMASVSSKRFDTRFFVAAVPALQTARHDDYEASASTWLAPRAALQRYREGRIDLAPPQIMSLAHLARHADVAGVMAEARGKAPALVQPEPFDDADGVRVLCYPGDPRHSVRERALPGPTRLRYQDRRFLPEDGFEALFR